MQSFGNYFNPNLYSDDSTKSTYQMLKMKALVSFTNYTLILDFMQAADFFFFTPRAILKAPSRPGGQVGGVIPKFVNEVKYFHADLAMFIMLKGNYTKLVSCNELMWLKMGNWFHIIVIYFVYMKYFRALCIYLTNLMLLNSFFQMLNRPVKTLF